MISQTTHDTIDGVEIGNRDLPSCIRCCESHTQFHSTFHTLQATYRPIAPTEGAISDSLRPLCIGVWALICATNTQDPFNSCQIRSLEKSKL